MQISDILAIMAILISISSLWLQNFAEKKQLMLGNFIEYTKRYQDIISHFPREIVEDSFDLDSLPDEEQENILRHMWLYFDLCYEQYNLYKLGFINNKLWKLWESNMQSAFSRPAFQICWRLISERTNYPLHSDFNCLIEKTILAERDDS